MKNTRSTVSPCMKKREAEQGEVGGQIEEGEEEE